MLNKNKEKATALLIFNVADAVGGPTYNTIKIYVHLIYTKTY